MFLLSRSVVCFMILFAGCLSHLKSKNEALYHFSAFARSKTTRSKTPKCAQMQLLFIFHPCG